MVGFAGAFAAVGTLFYSRRFIHADASKEDPSLVIYTLLAQPGDMVTPSMIYRRSETDESSPQTKILEDTEVVRMQLGALSGFGTIDGESGISRFDSISVPSSALRLDTTLVSSNSMMVGSTWTIFTLHEGFGSSGWANLMGLSHSLHAALLGGLISVFAKYEHSPEHSEVGEMMTYAETLEDDGFDDAVITKMKETFTEVDHSFVQRPFESIASLQPPPKSWVMASLGTALGGSSALTAFYDHEPRKLRVANTGNTRAVLGRKSAATKDSTQPTYSVHVLSEDHTIDAAPGLSRAFGLGPYKWTQDLQERLHQDFMGDPPLSPSMLKLTAEPTVTTMDVRPGDFMVLGTHGLWNSLTSEEVVGLVGLWINRDMSSLAPDAPPPIGDSIMPSDLPSPLKKDDTVTYKRWGREKRFTCVDNNAAQHLSRNALGGADVHWTAQLLATHPPRAQNLRDDITVTVVFFDDHS
ncbi:hypothetical protein H0H87_003430 [Tephrocybe sp. NHM501043]|nr:hypothetical protein H0H87_003430 [Tephrocybe sp. NHM501043]